MTLRIAGELATCLRGGECDQEALSPRLSSIRTLSRLLWPTRECEIVNRGPLWPTRECEIERERERQAMLYRSRSFRVNTKQRSE